MRKQKAFRPLPRCLSPEAEALWVRYHAEVAPLLEKHPARLTTGFEAWRADLLPLWKRFTAKVAKL